MEITGKIIAVLPLRSGLSKTSGNQWQSQEYVLETAETYPKRVCFEVFGERVQKFAIKEGEILTVNFDIDAREYNGRWFNSVKAWNVSRQQAQQPAASPYGAQPYYAPQPVAPYGVDNTRYPQPTMGQNSYYPQATAPAAQPAAAKPTAQQQQPAAAKQDDSDDLPF